MNAITNLRRIFQGKKPDKAQPFRAVLSHRFVAEYRGSLPATPFAIHSFYCDRIKPQDAALLVAEGVISIGDNGATPTHLFLCVAYLKQNLAVPRPLFHCYFDLSSIAGLSLNGRSLIQDAVARSIAQKLYLELKNQQYKELLIRCIAPKEFEFCLKEVNIDEYWATSIGVYYRAAVRSLLRANISES